MKMAVSRIGAAYGMEFEAGRTEKKSREERTSFDDELKQKAKKETETKTDIMVKADGSRVLVMTVKVGGMETTTGLEISRPTNWQNDCSKEGSDNRMSGGEREAAIPLDRQEFHASNGQFMPGR